MTLREIYSFEPKKYGYWFLGWTLLALTFSYVEIRDAFDGGFNGQLWEPWVWVFTALYSIALLAPVVVFFCYRWPMDEGQKNQTLFKLALSYLVFAPVHTSLMYAARELIYFCVGENYDNGPNYLYEFFKPMIGYFLVAFVTYAYIAFDRVQQEQAQSSRLAVELAQARLENLQNQLQPHFLFNTLNLISSTMYQDLDKADDVITELADLLRYSLTTTDQPFITLQQELTISQTFLNIVKLRFGERVSIDIKVDDKIKDTMVPSMLLQPLLENAVKHGIEPTTKPGSIEIGAKPDVDKIVITIINSDPGVNSTQESFGIGLKNTRRRLDYLYQDQAQIELRLNNNGFTSVEIVIPADKLAGEQS